MPELQQNDSEMFWPIPRVSTVQLLPFSTLQSLQELGDACTLFDILRLNICIHYCKIKTRCANEGNQEQGISLK